MSTRVKHYSTSHKFKSREIRIIGIIGYIILNKVSSLPGPKNDRGGERETS